MIYYFCGPMSQQAFLEHMEQEAKNLLERTRASLSALPSEAHRLRPSDGGWTILECFAHLNAQFTYFLPKIEMALHKAKARQWTPGSERKSNGLGRAALKRVMSEKPRRSYKSMDPARLNVTDYEVKTFLIHLEMLARQIKQANEIDLNKARIKHFRWPHFSFLLGDLFEVLIRHSQRHVEQAQRIQLP